MVNSKKMHATNTITVIVFLLISSTSAELVASQCRWKNGAHATDFQVCDPTAAQSACCLHGEACLANGLCFGSIGAIYRGACAGGWGNSTACPDQCNTLFDGGWANLFHCPLLTPPQGASEWWCGDGSKVSPCDANGTSANPSAAQLFSLALFGNLPSAIMPWSAQNFTGCAVDAKSPLSVQNQVQAALDNAEASQTTSSNMPSSNSTSTPIPTPQADTQCPNGEKIGLGVAVGILAVLCAVFLGWALWERKQRRAYRAEYSRLPKSHGDHHGHVDPVLKSEVVGTERIRRAEKDARYSEIHEMRGDQTL